MSFFQSRLDDTSPQQGALRAGAIVPIVLCGGSGTRLWPVSRKDHAKQHAPVLGGEAPFQGTLRRLAASPAFAQPIVVASAASRFLAADQAAQVGVGIELMLEPEGRDTLAAVTLAALALAERGNDAIGLMVPSDHMIPDAEAFAEAACRAAAAAAEGGIVVLGLAPRGPATGFGYIRPGVPAASGGYRVEAFVEKPDAARAERLVAEGYLWNAGMLCFRADAVLREIERHAPATLAAVRKGLDEGGDDLGALLPGAAFSAAPRVSFDVGVLEKTDRAVVIAADFAWSGVGDWKEVWALAAKGEDGVAREGNVVAKDSRDSYIRSDEGRLIAAVGIEGLAVIDTPDALLICPLDRSQEIKGLVADLAAEGRPEAHTPARVYRPWGWYQTMDLGPRFRVKRIQVTPGAQLSLQRHHHRAEHWVVVRGTAEVTRGEETTIVRENESVYLPLGCVHRLANPGRIPVEIVEIQTGSYLEEDDIVRIEDDFGRE
jgi:mannose-1-phosphate guanylyltransferase/mannose-6-phosphate isomerase